jgi:hypothetical protein
MNRSEEKMGPSRVANFWGIGINPMTHEAMFARIEEENRGTSLFIVLLQLACTRKPWFVLVY